MSGTIQVLDISQSLGFTLQLNNSTHLKIIMSNQKFLDVLHENNVADNKDGNVVLDYYVEDDDCKIYCQTAVVSVEDYIMNYITNEIVRIVLQSSLFLIHEQIKPQEL